MSKKDPYEGAYFVKGESKEKLTKAQIIAGMGGKPELPPKKMKSMPMKKSKMTPRYK